MELIKIRSYLEVFKEDETIGTMNYNPEFNGDINKIFSTSNQRHPNRNVKIQYMLWAGVQDKKCKDVYDKDIVKVYFKQTGETYVTDVYWGGKDYPAFDLNMRYLPHVYFDSNAFSIMSNTDEFDIEVIGNTLENPELLDGANTESKDCLKTTSDKEYTNIVLWTINEIPVTDYSVCGEELEYVLVKDTHETRKAIDIALATYFCWTIVSLDNCYDLTCGGHSMLEECSEDGQINVCALIYDNLPSDITDKITWSKSTGFVIKGE